MTHERSDAAHFAWEQAAQRLDYFLTGVSAALVGYVGQSLELTQIGLNRGTGEIIAVALFAGSFWGGVRRLEAVTTGQRFNASRLFHSEAADEISRAAQTGELHVSPDGNEVFLPAHLQVASRDHRALVEALSEAIERSNEDSLRRYRWRNRLLIGGFVVLVGARLLDLLP